MQVDGYNAILYADQVDTKILHELQRVQNIGCISAKSGELKDAEVCGIRRYDRCRGVF